MQVLTKPPSGWPALVLNADFRPLSYYPLSLWSWQDVIKAVWQDRVDVVSTYDKVVRSPSMEFRLPSVVSLKDFVDQDRSPAFTRRISMIRVAVRKVPESFLPTAIFLPTRSFMPAISLRASTWISSL